MTILPLSVGAATTVAPFQFIRRVVRRNSGNLCLKASTYSEASSHADARKHLAQSEITRAAGQVVPSIVNRDKSTVDPSGQRRCGIVRHGEDTLFAR